MRKAKKKEKSSPVANGQTQEGDDKTWAEKSQMQ